MVQETASSAPDFLTPEEQAAEADAAQWSTVSEEDVDETKVTFDNRGDQFIGDYIGYRVIDRPEGKLLQYRFQVGTFYYFINSGFSLAQNMTKVNVGETVRITYINDRETGQDSPMKVFRIDVAKSSRKPANTRRNTVKR